MARRNSPTRISVISSTAAGARKTLGAGVFRVRLVDEGGKININRMNEEALRRIFTNLGLDNQRRDILVDSIMDWRDPDDLHRINGAESEYYSTQLPAYGAKNGPLDSVEDLLWIRGMTAELFFGYAPASQICGAKRAARVALKDIFTVDSPIDRVNLRTASAEVIHAVMGIRWKNAGVLSMSAKSRRKKPWPICCRCLASVPVIQPCSCLFLPIRRWSQ